MSTLCEQEKITTSLPPIGSMGLVYFTLDGWLFFFGKCSSKYQFHGFAWNMFHYTLEL